MQLTPAQIAGYARDAGFSGEALVTAVAVVLQESGGDTMATNVNGPTSDAPGSVDRGLAQFNSLYHSEVTDPCAFDPACALGAMYRTTRGGADWSAWGADFPDRVARHMATARAAVDSLRQQSAGAAGDSVMVAAAATGSPAGNTLPAVGLLLGAAALAWALR